jgi:hypothetical protein
MGRRRSQSFMELRALAILLAVAVAGTATLLVLFAGSSAWAQTPEILQRSEPSLLPSGDLPSTPELVRAPPYELVEPDLSAGDCFLTRLLLDREVCTFVIDRESPANFREESEEAGGRIRITT